jgi:hypothetical protein
MAIDCLPIKQTRHCLLSSLTPRFHRLIIFLFFVNSIYNHHVILLSSISHSYALMPFTFLILFVLIHNPPSSLSELVDCHNFTLSSLLIKHAPLKNKAVHSRPSQPWFTSQLHALKISCRQSQRIWLVLILPLIFNVSALQRIGVSCCYH